MVHSEALVAVVVGTHSLAVVTVLHEVGILGAGTLVVCTAISEARRSYVAKVVRMAFLGRVPLRWWSSIALRRWRPIVPWRRRSTVVWLLLLRRIAMLLALPGEERHGVFSLKEERLCRSLVSNPSWCNFR